MRSAKVEESHLAGTGRVSVLAWQHLHLGGSRG